MGQARQVVTELSQVRDDHRKRYEWAPVKGRVLDAACGCGYGSKILMDRGCEVVGLDMERSAIEAARLHFAGPKYYVADVQQRLMLAFDAVVSFETLEHLPRPAMALRVWREIASLLVCSVPNEERIPFRAEDFKDDDSPHLRHYTPAELEALLNKNGWAVTERLTQTDKRGELSDIRPGTDGRFLVYTCIPS